MADPTTNVQGTARALAIDAVTARVVSELRQNGVGPLLLKGAAVSRWLYGDDGSRWYADLDLLVGPQDLGRAEQVLGDLGFRRWLPVAGVNREESSDMWFRERDGMNVDLHRSLVGVRAEPATLWEAFAADTRSITLEGTAVDTLGPAQSTLHVVLHAAQHGVEARKPLQDLERAIEKVDAETWRAAAELARRVQAEEAFAAGLRLTTGGVALAEQLGLAADASTATLLRASSAPHLALGIERLATSPGFRGKSALLLRKLVPEPSFMRAWSPLARRGPLGLAAAYAWRPLYLAKGAPGALLAWRHARRAAAGSDEPAQ